jgi:hypothetical protein
MSILEHILYKAHKKCIYSETMDLAQEIKIQQPKMEVQDRYELAYEKAKQQRKINKKK